MVELAEERSAAAWKIKNLQDYDGRLERAARRIDEISRERPEDLRERTQEERT
jgi:hypothetical protein